MSGTSQKVTNRKDDLELPDHPVIENGTYVAQTTRPCALRKDGGSLIQNHPAAVRQLLDLDPGTVPMPIVHPDLNAVTYVYR